MTEEALITQILNDYFAALKARNSARIEAFWHPEGTLFINGEPRPRALLTELPPFVTYEMRGIQHIEIHPPLAWAEVRWHMLMPEAIGIHRSFFTLVQDDQKHWRITHQTDHGIEKDLTHPPTYEHEDAAAGTKGVQNKPIAPPKAMKVQTTPDKLTISWFEPPNAIGTLLLIGVFFLFVVNKNSPLAGTWAVPIGIAVIIISFLYELLAMAINKTIIEVTAEYVRLTQKPLPLLMSPKEFFYSSDIKQLYILLTPPNRYNLLNRDYQIIVRTHQRKHKLLATTGSRDAALYIEEAIENFLGISDEAVYGEWHG